MLRWIVVCVLALSSCSEGQGSLDVLEDVPIHAEVAALMPPGRLAMLQLRTLGDYQWNMEARSSTAIQLWSHWADHIDECFDDGDIDQKAERFVAPADDSPVWDLMREPDGPFRPYGEQWNAEHGFASVDHRDFWESDEIAYLELSSVELMDSDCARSTYPYDALIQQPDVNESYGGFLDSLALTLHEQFEPLAWADVASATARLDELGQQVNLTDCLADGGVPQWVLDSDHYEVFAQANFDRRPLDEGAQYSIVEAACYEQVYSPVDDELLEIAVEYVEQNSEVIAESLLVDEWVAEWIGRLPTTR